MNIKLANSTYELFEIVSLKRKEFNAEHIMQVLRTLFQLQKNEKYILPFAASGYFLNIFFYYLALPFKLATF